MGLESALKATVVGGEGRGLRTALFMLLWFLGLGLVITSCAFTRGDITKQLSLTAEYQCLVKATGKPPYVSWDSVRYLRGTSGSGATTATIKDRKTTRCIRNGGAATFVTLPVGKDGKIELVRFPGTSVSWERGGRGGWYDVVSEDGTFAYRNDGAGYYRTVR